MTRTPRPDRGRVKFHTGDLAKLVRDLKKNEGKTIYCDGGAEVINELLKHDLIDEMTISIIPILVGNGVRLFQDGRAEQNLKLVHTATFDTGLVQLRYVKS